jgi:uncharacterized membrane protein required for colicin V production
MPVGAPIVSAVTSLAAVTPDAVDAAVGVALLVFALWGAMRGAVRQAVGVVVLAAAFLVASLVSPRIAPNVAKVATLSADANAGIAYLTAFIGTVIVCAVLLHWVRSGLDRAPRGRALSRLGGALLGLVQGAAVLTLTLYAVLAAHVAGPSPSGSPPPAPSDTIRAIRESRCARALADVEPSLRPVFRLPQPVSKRVDAVNEWVTGAPR